MSDREIQIGVLREYTDGKWKHHPIYSWEGYGVVMPSEITSNGSAEMVANTLWEIINVESQLLTEMGDSVKFLVEVGGEDVSDESIKGIKEHLLEAHGREHENN